MNPLPARIAILVCLICPSISQGAEAAAQAVSGTVSGRVQGVGFRAHIFRQAIRYNLAGSAQNRADGTVRFSLQGDVARIRKALAAIQAGTAQSSDVKIVASPTQADAGLDSFRVIGWTSVSRDIKTPHDLVFHLRPDGTEVSGKQASEVYHAILKAELESAGRR